MILVFFFASFLLSCLPFLHSATDPNSSMPICPESFSCPNFSPLKYPFYNVTDSRCGLIKVNCTSNGGSIQLGGHSYEIGSQYGSQPWVSVRNRTFERLVNERSCEALMDNFISPSPLLYSISVLPSITLYKCTNKPDFAAQMDAYFDQLPNYHRYNICQNHIFYYNNSNSNTDTTVPSDLPPTCQVIQLPVKLRQPDDHKVLDETNIFSHLTSVYSIYFYSASCKKCDKVPGWCRARCFQPKNVAAEKPRRKTILILALCIGLVTSLVLIILCFIRKLRWKIKTKKHLNVESFLENHEFLAKRYCYMQAKRR